MTTAHDLLLGFPFGTVLPTRPSQPLPPVDGRTKALRILRQYISELRFSRPDRGDRPIPYQIPLDHIHIEQPKQAELVFPSIIFRPGADGRYDGIGLGCYINEATLDVYGVGMAVQEQSEWIETITLECWAEEGPQRSSMVAGLEQALVPIEQYYGLRFRMPDYYDRTVCFSLNSGARPDDPDAAGKNRKWGILQVEMRFNVVALVDFTPMRTEESLFVDDDPIEAVTS